MLCLCLLGEMLCRNIYVVFVFLCVKNRRALVATRDVVGWPSRDVGVQKLDCQGVVRGGRDCWVLIP